MKFKIDTTYFPVPHSVSQIYPQQAVDDIKYKKYTTKNKITSIRSELHLLKNNNFTHVINMPGNLKSIAYDARCLGIVVLDKRMPAYISESF